MRKFTTIVCLALTACCCILFILLKNDLVRYPLGVNWDAKCPRRTVETDGNIVKIIHQSWKTTKVPEFLHNYSLSWTKECFKDWTYMFWTDEDNFNLISVFYPWFIEKYKSLPSNIYRADVSRYFYLFHYGGVYTDLDNECLKPFQHLLGNYSLVFGAMEGQYKGTTLKEGYVQNSFMYSKPRHEFWMNMIMSIFQFKGFADPEVYTGPVMLSNQIKSYRDRINSTNEIKIYPPNLFNPFSWLNKTNADPNCKDFNKMTAQELNKCRQSMRKRGSFVVQYHAHTW